MAALWPETYSELIINGEATYIAGCEVEFCTFFQLRGLSQYKGPQILDFPWTSLKENFTLLPPWAVIALGKYFVQLNSTEWFSQLNVYFLLDVLDWEL